jgi:uncharacterized protein (TIGR03435 family)
MLVAGGTAVLVPTVFILARMPVVLAQGAAAREAVAQQTAGLPAAAFAFDAASIRPSASDIRSVGGGFIASGYRVTNFPLAYIVLTAYLPGNDGNQLVGMPDWAYKERYDIVAHIDEATAPSWLKLNGRQMQQAGRPMLQNLLAERCKLVAHTVPAQVDGYALIVSKRGSKLQPAQPRESYPAGVKDLDPEGGKVLSATPANNNTMTFFNVLIPDLASIIGVTSNSVVQDQTNLTGRYDFTIRRLDIPRDVDGTRIANPEPSDFWEISATGLELKRAKLPSQNLVIDHIERPSPN